MVAYFKRECYLMSGVGAGLGLAAGLLLWMVGVFTGAPAFVIVFYLLLTVLVGIIGGRLFAALWAGKKLRAIHDILYRQDDPQRYLDTFTPIVDRTNPETAEAMSGRVKLAFAMEALGKFGEAQQSLEAVDPDSLKLHALPVAANLRNQQLRLALLQEDREKAAEYLADLNRLQEIAMSRAAMLAANLKECIRLGNCWMDVLDGKDTDEAYLTEEIRLAGNNVHKSEMQLLLAKAKVNVGAVTEALDLLVDAKAAGTNFWVFAAADALIKQLS